MQVSPDARLLPAPNVVTRPVANELVLLNRDTEVYFGLDPVGASMWRALCDEGTLAGAHRVLAVMYDVDGEQLRADLEELASTLLQKQLLLDESGE